MPSQKIAVAGVQIPQLEGSRDENLLNAKEAISANPGNTLYVLPELSSSGYGVSTFRRLGDLAENLDGPSFEYFSTLAKKQGCFICYSFPRRVGTGEFSISTAVVNRAGDLVAHYDKWHVCSTGDCCEKDYFIAGTGPLAAFEVDGIQVGLAICYDIRFPEVVRKLTLHKGISLLLHPGGWPKDKGFYSWHKFVQVRAMENSIYIMSTNWAGPNNGCTAFCPPFLDGEDYALQKLGDEPGVLEGSVDLQEIKALRTEYPYLKDRNEKMYGDCEAC